MDVEPAVRVGIDAWLSDPAIAEPDKVEVRRLWDGGDARELADRFYGTLEFGTGGLRGILGAGTNRMNLYTVGAAAQGLANYIRAAIDRGMSAGNPAIAVAYDCRRMSREFAERVAGVMAANGIVAHVFAAPRPTPHLSFAVRHLKCISGVVITASHNPPEYNGFKAYWDDGGQVVPPHDAGIIDEVRRVGAFANVRSLSFADGVSRGFIQVLGREMDDAFLTAVQSSTLNPEACRRQAERLRIVCTNLHGTGDSLIPEALRRRGFKHILPVREQAGPNGEFPTVKSPNPEEPAALAMAIDLARKEKADLVIGTDPDCDRMGIAVRRLDGDYAVLTGNQIGAMLCYYLCDELTRQNRFPHEGMVISTIVSGGLMKAIGRAFGAEVVETLTGFKWIAEKIRVLDGRKAYIFGAEESYGYMPCTYVRDKDAVTSAALIAEFAAVCAERGQTLIELLDSLYKRYGYFEEGARGIQMPGQDGAERIRELMNRLRTDPPASIAGLTVVEFADLSCRERRNVTEGRSLPPFDLPASDVVLFTLAEGTQVIARPSGTEPKIKFYILTHQPGGDLIAARQRALQTIASISAELGTWTQR